ncbi:MAG: outer membrane lipoprotein-sorting protein [Deferrisomatales bacterium]|nr:outer membrane lipoprotein-sorting protein [Deferrisomatales bacterium]
MQRRWIALALAAALGPGAALALTVEEIVDRANRASFYAGDDGIARATMVISDRQDRTRERELTILRKDVEDGGEQLYYVYFHRPGDVRRTVFLVHKRVGRDDDRWLYLPALDLVRRIAASDKRTSFVGSHFFYEDVSGRSPADDTHTLVEETAEHYVLDNVPKDPRSVEFARYRVWIDKETFLPMAAEYTDAQGKVYRRMEVLEVKDVGGYPTATKARIEDRNTGGSTLLAFDEVAYDQGISADIFTERYLRTPPREYIRR